MEIVSIIGAATGVIAFLGVIYAFGWKFGHIHTKLQSIESKLIDPQEIGKITSKVDSLYQIYVLDALKKQSDTNPSQNPNPAIGEVLSEDFKVEIRKVTLENRNKDTSDIVTLIFSQMAATKSRDLIDLLKRENLSSPQFIFEVTKYVEAVKRQGD